MKSFSIFLLEKKDHIIKRLKNLSPEEKDQVITFFAKKPNLENQVDWQNRDLTFKDFQKVMDTTKTERKKAVKKMGLAGLKEGKDYIELRSEFVPECYKRFFVPLNHEASKLLASTKIGGIEGKWCVASNTPEYWNIYVYDDKQMLIFVFDYEDGCINDKIENKTAILIREDFKLVSVWGSNGREVRLFDSGFDKESFPKFISENIADLKKSLKLIFKQSPFNWLGVGLNAGTIKIEHAKNVSLVGGNPVWSYGTWIDGVWEDGTWMSGLWKDGRWKKGTWKGGIWTNGTWNAGLWENGEWHDGTWDDGVWNNGTWYAGDWLHGIWKGGRWEDGAWEDGTWKGGWWKGGTWYIGSWENGNWQGGEWQDGEWQDGMWEDGTWEDGIWYGGIWYDGEWQNGVWNDGLWKDGTWEGGTWEGGRWEDGTWKGGVWESGTWEGGYDKDGKYHEAGDSPDNW